MGNFSRKFLHYTVIFVQKAFLLGLFSGSLFSEGLIIGGNFAFHIGLDSTIKTASTNSPWAYIREGLLWEGYLRLRFGGLIFRRAYLFVYFIFWGGEGGGLLSEVYGISSIDVVLNCLHCFSLSRSQTIKPKTN